MDHTIELGRPQPLGQPPEPQPTDGATQLEGLLEDVARHLSTRSSGRASVLALGTSLDSIGALRQRLALHRAVEGTAPTLAKDALLRRLSLEVLIRVVHLGGAEFYTSERSLGLFRSVLGEAE